MGADGLLNPPSSLWISRRCEVVVSGTFRSPLPVAPMGTFLSPVCSPRRARNGPDTVTGSCLPLRLAVKGTFLSLCLTVTGTFLSPPPGSLRVSRRCEAVEIDAHPHPSGRSFGEGIVHEQAQRARVVAKQLPKKVRHRAVPPRHLGSGKPARPVRRSRTKRVSR